MCAEIKDRLSVTNWMELHIPIVFLVDTSAFMLGKPIDELNQELVQFYETLERDDLVLYRTEVSVISFGGSVNIEVGFRPAEQYEPPVLSAGGTAAMNEGILKALNEIEMRKQLYREQGIGYYRPWLIVLSNGFPTDVNLEEQAISVFRRAIDVKKIRYFPVNINLDIDSEHLKKYYPEDWSDKRVFSVSVKEFSDLFAHEFSFSKLFHRCM